MRAILGGHKALLSGLLKYVFETFLLGNRLYYWKAFYLIVMQVVFFDVES